MIPLPPSAGGSLLTRLLLMLTIGAEFLYAHTFNIAYNRKVYWIDVYLCLTEIVMPEAAIYLKGVKLICQNAKL